MLARADRLHRQMFQPVLSGARPPAWEPPVDVLETEREVLVIVALPGVNADRVEAAIEGPELVLEGTRTFPPSSRPPSSIVWSCRRAASSAGCACRTGATTIFAAPRPTVVCWWC